MCMTMLMIGFSMLLKGHHTAGMHPLPVDRIIEQGLHPHPGPETEEGYDDLEADENVVILESLNITNMEHNKQFVVERKAHILGFQEHKIKDQDIRSMEAFFDQEGWQMKCGPSDQTTKKPGAGVGIAVRPEAIKLIPTEIRTDSFREAYQAGRADKHLVGLGWSQNMQLYILYGKSGGSGGKKGEARDVTDAVVQAIREEINHEAQLPTIILGDFNAEPETLPTTQEMIEEDSWTEIGSNAHWWGGGSRTSQPAGVGQMPLHQGLTAFS